MQLPWVSRDDSRDSILAAITVVMKSASDDKAILQVRYDDLLEKYHALRLLGASLPEQQKYEEPVMPPEILMRAIREVSPTQDHAYSMNYQWAMALKDHWNDDGKMREAAQQIRYGSAYTPDMDDDT